MGSTRVLVAGAAFALTACAAPDATVDEAALADWLDAYGAAWEDKDTAAAAALFTADATYRETPYSEPFEGRDEIGAYWAEVTADQRDIDFESEVVAVSGDTGVATWSARFMSISGGVPVELDGIFVLELTAEGEVRSLREWWHAR